ncbi:site-2 protease family protein [Fonticella tunisiensis]|uniref:Zn-dependent protease n=1 Tax=Fonticella tunisiensis TaxID=1096341 RepID=A0A4R7KSL8_9CLOT|nr:site-2 protease family protein [Fonticella tunisiensis]TDT61916.1 Zn-dependent protease [Fonticella tunisiensis]
MDITNFDFASFILRGIAVIISLSIHEYSHALVSYMQGDKTPQYYGRLTLNPLAHIDVMGLIALFVFKFGWAKPVPINSYYYKNERAGVVLTSMAGPLSNLLLAFFSILILLGIQPRNSGVEAFLWELFVINIGLAVFNILPFPPLDGSKIFAELFGGKVAEFIYRIERTGIFILFFLLWIPEVSRAFGGLIGIVAEFIFKVAANIVV